MPGYGYFYEQDDRTRSEEQVTGRGAGNRTQEQPWQTFYDTSSLSTSTSFFA